MFAIDGVKLPSNARSGSCADFERQAGKLEVAPPRTCWPDTWGGDGDDRVASNLLAIQGGSGAVVENFEIGMQPESRRWRDGGSSGVVVKNYESDGTRLGYFQLAGQFSTGANGTFKLGAGGTANDARWRHAA